MSKHLCASPSVKEIRRVRAAQMEGRAGSEMDRYCGTNMAVADLQISHFRRNPCFRSVLALINMQTSAVSFLA